MLSKTQQHEIENKFIEQYAADIKKWKAEHGVVKVASFEMDSKTKEIAIFIIAQPTMDLMDEIVDSESNSELIERYRTNCIKACSNLEAKQDTGIMSKITKMITELGKKKQLTFREL